MSVVTEHDLALGDGDRKSHRKVVTDPFCSRGSSCSSPEQRCSSPNLGDGFLFFTVTYRSICFDLAMTVTSSPENTDYPPEIYLAAEVPYLFEYGSEITSTGEHGNVLEIDLIHSCDLCCVVAGLPSDCRFLL
ncbi:hypothetical protein QVD17_28155 [Tagetes erecta]|uniref:Uncharacterized protein n=1 Tax=Tagetes erecta TaxID=13708 RepID=A0AAD8K9U9_TARER|nr:hypothetical protein QVD17_28155 [Tagetes erecta]